MRIINENNFLKARDLIRKNHGKVIFTCSDDELSRKVLEKEKIEILLINQSKRKDFQKQRNSGFNQVLARFSKKNNVKIGINLDEVKESKGKEKSEILARIRQNVILCNKNKLDMKFLEFKNKGNIYDIKSLGLVLGMPTWMIKKLENGQRKNN